MRNAGFAETLTSPMIELLTKPMILFTLPDTIQSIQTISRVQLLRETAQNIIDNVKSGQVEPGEIAIIAPGLDAIARYTLTEILLKQDIPVQPLNQQRPIIANPAIRTLPTLKAVRVETWIYLCSSIENWRN